MRELNVCEVGAVAGGSWQSTLGNFALNVFAGYVGNVFYNATTSPSNSTSIVGRGGYSDMGSSGFNSQGNALGGSKANSESGD